MTSVPSDPSPAESAQARSQRQASVGRSGLRACVRGTPEMVALWNRICDEGERSEAAWIARLREQGVKAAHPDDGWVDRTHNTVQFCYPQFNDGVRPGDLIALGWDGEPPKYKRKQWRIVRATEKCISRWGEETWAFEPLPEPPAPSSPSLIGRVVAAIKRATGQLSVNREATPASSGSDGKETP